MIDNKSGLEAENQMLKVCHFASIWSMRKIKLIKYDITLGASDISFG
jgi:hypothetical protein